MRNHGRLLLACSLALAVVSSGFAATQPLIISEFRLRGANGAGDEFVEIYNNTNSPLTVSVSDASSGFALVASDGVTRFIIPNNTVIPARSHYLGANSTSYSLGSYATANATYTTGINDNAGIALFKTANPANFTLANRLDAAGSASEANTLYKEGTGYPALNANDTNFAIVRKLSCPGVTINTSAVPNGAQGTAYTATIAAVENGSGGTPIDTDNNSTDFRLVDVQGTLLCTSTAEFQCQLLGTPGPENLVSAIERSATLPVTLADPAVSPSAVPNLVRDFTSDPANNSPLGTVFIRRKITNYTGASLTRMRLRIHDISTFPPASGVSDLRVRSSVDVTFTFSGGGTQTARGLTLEQPPTQSIGGGYNSTLSVGTVTLGTPLANGASIYLNILLGVASDGVGRFHFVVEGLP